MSRRTTRSRSFGYHAARFRDYGRQNITFVFGLLVFLLAVVLWMFTQPGVRDALMQAGLQTLSR